MCNEFVKSPTCIVRNKTPSLIYNYSVKKRRHQLLADCQITDNLDKGKKNQKSKSLAIGYPALNIIENI